MTMKPLENLLLTTDFSDLAREAYPAAARIARDSDARIHLVHEAESLSPIFAEFKHRSQFEKLSSCLEREAEHAALAGLDVTVQLLHQWTRHETLAEYIGNEGIDLVVQSTHGRSGLAHLFLGSFAERVARTSPAPVLTYRRRQGAEEPLELRSILVPYDFSENACVAFPAARALALRYDASVRVVNVQPSTEEFLYPYLGLLPGDDRNIVSFEQRRSHARDALETVARKELAGARATFDVASGDPWSGIVETAKASGVDLIVMGTHGWTGMQHWLLGSVAEKVIRHAPCSVLSIRPRAIRAGARKENRATANLPLPVARHTPTWYLVEGS